jgi:hypothetical protein
MTPATKTGGRDTGWLCMGFRNKLLYEFQLLFRAIFIARSTEICTFAQTLSPFWMRRTPSDSVFHITRRTPFSWRQKVPVVLVVSGLQHPGTGVGL